jgi:hypothetical protein
MDYILASSYDSTTYSGSTSNTTSMNSSNGGSTVNTGVPILLFTGLAVVLVLTALFIKIIRRSKTPKPKPIPLKSSPGSYGSGSF